MLKRKKREKFDSSLVSSLHKRSVSLDCKLTLLMDFDLYSFVRFKLLARRTVGYAVCITERVLGRGGTNP